jgi:hypothetical protein
MLNISKYDLIRFLRPPKQSETVLEMEPLPKVEKEQVSISSTFYGRLFIRKCFAKLFSNYSLAFWLFLQNKIGTKAARKMLIKLTTALLSPREIADAARIKRVYERTKLQYKTQNE